MENVNGKRIVLFDGQCNFCNSTVLFIIDRDPRAQFAFAPLQSELGQELLRTRGFSDVLPETVVLIDGARVFTRSTAGLRIALGLNSFWPVLGALGYLVPRPLRDAAYRAFATRRYRWFGKSEQCRVPTPELKERFLAMS
jgi:predicted DCC family thiol-disulfide oxidoreductase YuxK